MSRNSTSKSSSKETPASTYQGHRKGEHQDALDILADDHKKVIKMFDKFKKLNAHGEADEEELQALVENACAELTIHNQAEEELFYPILRDALDDASLIDEAQVEHASARQLISELAAMQPSDELYDAKFTVLGEYVKHHIREEESEIFPKAKKARLDLEAMGDDIQQRKQQLREELGMAYQDEDEEERDEEQAPSSERRSIH